MLRISEVGLARKVLGKIEKLFAQIRLRPFVLKAEVHSGNGSWQL